MLTKAEREALITLLVEQRRVYLQSNNISGLNDYHYEIARERWGSKIDALREEEQCSPESTSSS